MSFNLPIVLDGATGTELAKAGLSAGDISELWMLEHKEAVIALKNGYIDAGSDAVYSPTFGCSKIMLANHGLKGREKELNGRLFALEKEGLTKDILIGGDIGPSGEMMRPFGNYGFDEIYDSYLVQAEALEEAGADFFAVETMTSISEARAAFLAVRSVSEKPVIVTFSCDKNGRTLDGSDVVSALVIFQAMGAYAFGLNCSWGPSDMLPVLKKLSGYTDIPLVAKPNAGLPVYIDGKATYSCTPEEFTAYVKELLSAGVGLLGGCCGTDRTHIRALSEKVRLFRDEYKAPEKKGLVLIASEKQIIDLKEAFVLSDTVAVDDAFEDTLDEVLYDDSDILLISVDSETDFARFEEAQYLLSKPVCLAANDASILERALALYRGRALVKTELSETELAPLKEKYGFIDMREL